MKEHKRSIQALTKEYPTSNVEATHSCLYITFSEKVYPKTVLALADYALNHGLFIEASESPFTTTFYLKR